MTGQAPRPAITVTLPRNAGRPLDLVGLLWVSRGPHAWWLPALSATVETS
jgi:hypothetical protein